MSDFNWFEFAKSCPRAYDGDKFLRSIDDEEKRLKDVRTISDININKDKDDRTYWKNIEILRIWKLNLDSDI